MDISYFHGREVESVTTEDDPSEAVWIIHLNGNGAIYGYGESEAPAVEGLALMSSAQENDGEVTKVYFGTDENPSGTVLVLRKGEYAISDEVYSAGEVEHPGDAMGASLSAEAPEPEDQPGETPDGPSEAFLASQEQPEDDGA